MVLSFWDTYGSMMIIILGGFGVGVSKVCTRGEKHKLIDGLLGRVSETRSEAFPNESQGSLSD